MVLDNQNDDRTAVFLHKEKITVGTSKIEWTEKTWNPVTGCTKVSLGCKFCYAERLFPRVYKDRPFFDVQTHPERLEQPLRWQKPAMIFVNSMSDLFHEKVPFSFVEEVFDIMAKAKKHTFQVLTKRALRAHTFINAYCKKNKITELADNIWIGVSVENQEQADARIPLLLHCPAQVRFLSCEPLLGYIHFYKWVDKIEWVIVGGESGPKARPMEIEWAIHLKNQCMLSGESWNKRPAFFFKQMSQTGKWKERFNGKALYKTFESFPIGLQVREYPLKNG